MTDNSPTPTVFIVDDDKEVLRALTWLLESVNLSVECYESAIDFLAEYQPDRCGCIVADVRMPMMSGLQLFEQLKAQNNPLPVIFLTGHGDIPMAVNAIKSGAMDFISKPFNDQTLLDQIQKAIAINLKYHESKKSPTNFTLGELSKRENQVLELVVAGKLNKQIADELSISPSTVEFHRARLMKKIGAKNLAQLIKLYLAHKEE